MSMHYDDEVIEVITLDKIGVLTLPGEGFSCYSDVIRARQNYKTSFYGSIIVNAFGFEDCFILFFIM